MIYDQKTEINTSALLWTILGFILIYSVGTSFIIEVSQEKGYFIPKYMDKMLAFIAVFMTGYIFKSKSETMPNLKEYLILVMSFIVVYMMKFLFIAYQYFPVLLEFNMIFIAFFLATIFMLLFTFLSFYIDTMFFSMVMTWKCKQKIKKLMPDLSDKSVENMCKDTNSMVGEEGSSIN